MPKKILVADDSATIQRAVQIALSEEDVTLVEARRAADVLSVVREQAPDAILLDNQFHQDDAPDGYELCSAIKQDPTLSHIPIAFLASQSFDQGRGEEAGAVLFFEKPFESKTLIEGIEQLMQFSSAPAPAPVAAPEPPSAPLFSGEPEDDGGETVISTSPLEANRPSLAQPVPRETTAMPTFNPVAFGNLLGDDPSASAPVEEAPATPEPPSTPSSAPPLFSAPSSAPAPAEQLSDAPADPPSFAPPAPPPFPGSTAPAPPSFEEPSFEEPSFEEPEPPSFGAEPDAGIVTPPPLQAPPLTPPEPTPPPLSAPPQEASEPEFAEPAPPAPPSFGAPTPEPEVDKPRQKPLIIPAPSDAPREFPVKDLLSPSAAAPVEAEEDLEMEAPVFIEQQQHFEDPEGEDRTVVEYVPSAAMPDPAPVAPQTDTAPQSSNIPALAASAGMKVPDFALNPNENYLARALSGSRRTTLRRSSAGTGVQVQAVQEMAGETIERIAWEVVPELAELIIREMIDRQSR